jgi:hypothetical protein
MRVLRFRFRLTRELLYPWRQKGDDSVPALDEADTLLPERRSFMSDGRSERLEGVGLVRRRKRRKIRKWITGPKQ